MDLSIIHILTLVITVVLLQFMFKWTVGNKITSKEDMTNQSRRDYHMVRRVQHMATGLIIMFICSFSPKIFCILGALIGTLGVLLLNLYRFMNPAFNEKYIQNFGFLLRPHEINNMPGALYFLLGVTLCMTFFGNIEFYLSMIILSFGDPFASLFGIYFKTPFITKNKTIAGTLGCGLVCVVLSLLMYFCHPDFELVKATIDPLEFSLCVLVTAVLAEVGPSSRKICFDDNTSIPVYAGILLTGYFRYIHPLSVGK